jgi:hypothetical protein
MGGRGARARPKRKLTDEEIAAVAPPEQPTDRPEPTPTERAPVESTRVELTPGGWPLGEVTGEQQAAMESIRDAYDRLATRPGEAVPLTALRQELADMSHEDFQQALTDLSSFRETFLRGEADQKTLTPEDRATAVRLGGTDRHNLAFIAQPSQLPDVPPPAAPGATAETAPGASLTNEQRAAILRIGNTREVRDTRRMERELSDLGLFDKGTGWFTEKGTALFGQITTGHWTTDIRTADTLLPPDRDQP